MEFFIKLLLFMFLHVAVASTYRETQYYDAGSLAVFNNGTLYDLGNGLTGRYTNIHSNGTSTNVWDSLWFVNASNEEYYLCHITYSSLKSPTDFAPAQILWFANRNGVRHRSVGTNANLKFQSDGNLVLRDSQGDFVFETGTGGKGVQYLGIDYWLNMKLVTADYSVIWKSQSYPTNTLLMHQGFTQGMKLTSWLNTTDNSQGPYTMVMEPGGLVLYSDDSPYWIFSNSKNNKIHTVRNVSSELFAFLCTSDGEEGALFLSSNHSQLLSSGEVACNPSDNQTKLSLGPTILKSYSVTAFLKLESSGNLGAYFWDDINSEWSRFFLLFDSICDLPQSCGDYGVCKNSQCHCPSSFVAKNSSNVPMGCKIRSKGDTGFQEYGGMEYFSNQYRDADMIGTSTECKNFCERNTSCAAAFFNQTSSTCYLVQQVRTIKWTSDQNSVAFLKLGAANISETSSTSLIGIVTGSILGSLAAVLITLFLLFKFRKRAKKLSIQEEQLGQVIGPINFSYSQIREITTNFDTVIGMGGFARVYRGTVPGKGEVAVKVLNDNSHIEKEFFTETTIMVRIRHLNVVELVGYCLEEAHRILVYEYMPNGSLDKWIFGSSSHPLSWKQRFDIALGVARGMDYLHRSCTKKVLHLDLKPQNILLDSSYLPKVADFGISKTMDRDQSLMMTNTMRGTIGYLAPDWMQGGGITSKADVFSYGVVLLEILCGQKRSELSGRSLCSALDCKDEKSLPWKIIDIDAQLSINKDEAVRLVRVAFLCLQREPACRPSMSQIIQILEGVVSIPILSDEQREALKQDLAARDAGWENAFVDSAASSM